MKISDTNTLADVARMFRHGIIGEAEVAEYCKLWNANPNRETQAFVRDGTLQNHPKARVKLFAYPGMIDKFGIILKVLLLLAVLVGGRYHGQAAIAEADAVRALIGEAVNQPYEGQVALAAALRNRGHLRGVYGFSAKVLPRHTPQDRAQVVRAWRESAHRDPSKGATHWENTRAFGVPYWAKHMQVTVTIGCHTFYKGKQKS